MNQQLRCPSCNSNSLKEEGRFYVCEYCGGKIERGGQIAAAVSSADSVAVLLDRARLYWDLGKKGKAGALYRQVLDIDATNAEARDRAR